uniref:ABC transporter ATP-binding protein n=1 Tax=uncultured Thiodictyon sp. TaxID=1846217 RepID=UPI0025E7D46C
MSSTTVIVDAPDSIPAAVLAAEGVGKTFSQGPQPVEVLRGVTLQVPAGARIAIIGASGSGKSTLLHCIGGLERPTTGRVCWSGEDVSGLSEARRGRLRNRQLGFVYQFHHLLPEFSALDNVAMPLRIRRLAPDAARAQAQTVLAQVGLAARVAHRP